MAEVAVVIGNYEGERVLPDCLRSLERQTLAPVEVLVVDAGSRDRSRAVAESLGARVVTEPNTGLGHLYNAGVDAARARYVLLANNDVALEPECLERLASALDEDERRFAADPRQLDWAGGRVIHARTRLRHGALLRRPVPGLELDFTVESPAVAPTLTANAGAMLVRRTMFLELQGFDETFFMDYEDLDLCWRAWLRGWASVYVPEAVVRHRVGAVTGAAEAPARLRSSHHNLVRFALKCLPPRPLGSVLAGELLRLGAHPRPVAAALASVARELPEIARLRRELRPSRSLFDWLADGQHGEPPGAAGPLERAPGAR